MINFRYHVVSLTAVFFALAIGLVVGTAALNGPVADSLRDVVTTVAQFDKAGDVVVAASADAGNGNVVAEVRGDPQLFQTVSTVDNVDTPQGRLVAAWAVADRIRGRTGHYGIGAGATLVPKTTQ